MGMSKKNVKSQEELLKEALVPVEEQPYKVPENWVWVRLKAISNGTRRGIVPSQYPNEIFELYSVPSFALNEPEILTGKEINSNKQLVEEDDVLICKINPRINRVWKVNECSKYRQIGSTEWIVIPNNNKFNAKYLMYLFRSPYFRSLLTANVSGVGGSLTRARPKEVEKYPVALAPLNEQKRIADKVERLLDKINQAKELIESIPANTLELRQAILNKAFQGELTKKWRQDNQDSNGTSPANAESRHQPIPTCKTPNEWNWILSKDVFSFVTSGSRGWAKYYSDSGPLFIRIGNLNKNSINIDLTSEQRVSPPKGAEGTRTKVQHNDILVSITGEVGMIGLVPANFPEAYINQHVALARPISGVNPEYIAWFFVSREGGYKQFVKRQRGATKAGLGLEDIRNIWIPLPSLDEQKEVVRTINSLFSILDFTDVIRNNANELINKLPQSILSKAFRGDLGTNNINEKVELLLESLSKK